MERVPCQAPADARRIAPRENKINPNSHVVCGLRTAGHRVIALGRAARRRVKARRPRVGTTRGRSEAKSLEAPSTAPIIECAMAGARDCCAHSYARRGRRRLTNSPAWRGKICPVISMDSLVAVLVIASVVGGWWYVQYRVLGRRIWSPLWLAFSTTAAAVVFAVSGAIGYRLNKHERFVDGAWAGRVVWSQVAMGVVAGLIAAYFLVEGQSAADSRPRLGLAPPRPLTAMIFVDVAS